MIICVTKSFELGYLYFQHITQVFVAEALYSLKECAQRINLLFGNIFRITKLLFFSRKKQQLNMYVAEADIGAF